MSTLAAEQLADSATPQREKQLSRFAPEGESCEFATIDGRPVRSHPVAGRVAGRLYCFNLRTSGARVYVFELADADRGLTLDELADRYSPQPFFGDRSQTPARFIKNGGLTGAEYVFIRTNYPPPNGSRTIVRRVRVFVAHDQVYMATVACSQERQAEAEFEMTVFLDSFRVVDKP
ncbi:MAG: hypothetical protein KDA60_10455 [Planctomycetales bacterium]|nr:hypothetical protein [Planctomycetales bacterium]